MMSNTLSLSLSLCNGREKKERKSMRAHCPRSTRTPFSKYYTMFPCMIRIYNDLYTILSYYIMGLKTGLGDAKSAEID